MSDTENDTSKVPSPLIPNGIKDEGIPEKIWVHPVDISLYKLMFEKVCDMDNEYVLKSVADKKVADAIAPIREVYEKYDHLDKLLSNERLLGYGEDFERNIRFDLWQAINATVKRREIET